MAATAVRKSGLPGGGWLSMAPQDDPPPPPPHEAVAAESSTDSSSSAAPGSSFASTSYSSCYANPPPKPQSEAGGLKASAGAAGTSSQRRASYTYGSGYIPPRTRAVFEMGLPDVDSAAESPIASRYGSSNASPAFDVRNTFTALPRRSQGGVGVGFSSARRMSEVAPSYSMDVDGGALGAAVTGGEEAEDDEGFEYAGKKFRGKTAQAVELELEAFGDRTVMSYAPDAVYLASRLEGLKRNMETPGYRHRTGWLVFSDDEGEHHSDEDDAGSDAAASDVADMDALDELEQDMELHGAQDKDVDMAADELHRLPSVLRTGSASPVAGGSGSPHTPPDVTGAPMSLHQHVLRHGHGHAHSRHAHHHDDDGTTTEAGSEVASTIVASRPSRPTIDRAAKQHALDSRVEIRQLRRPDLEQVRELHCLHGDSSDKVDCDTYTTSAGFLLRLLVDENHVCLVAVAKPLPEPAPLPSLSSSHAPNAPPPSLDMAPTSSPYLLASRGMAAASPFLRATKGFAPSVPSLIDAGENDEQDDDDDDDEDAERDARSSSSATTRSDSIFSSSAPSASQGLSASPRDGGRASSGLPSRASHPRIAGLKASDAAGRLAIPSPSTNGGGGLSQGAPSTSSADGASSSSATGPQRHSSGASAETTLTAPTSTSNSPPEGPSGVSSLGAPRPYKPVLAGPMYNVAPPRAIRVMAAPPLYGLNPDQDTILGVASAHLSIRAPVPTLTLGGDPEEEGASQTKPIREAHILTLSTAHSERGQGLGARLLDMLMEECRKRGPTRSSSRDRQGRPYDPSEMPLRFYLEVHPSNASAMGLYHSRGLQRMKGERGIKRGFYRGDPRIGLGERLKVGGTDAWVLERFEEPGKGARATRREASTSVSPTRE